jgi:hypothetical protein
MNFKPSLVRAAATPCGFAYYALFLSHNTERIITCIQRSSRLKELASDPKIYLGAFIKPWSIPGDPRKIWSMSSSHYIKEALNNLEDHLQQEGLQFTEKRKATIIQS